VRIMIIFNVLGVGGIPVVKYKSCRLCLTFRLSSKISHIFNFATNPSHRKVYYLTSRCDLTS